MLILKLTNDGRQGTASLSSNKKNILIARNGRWGPFVEWIANNDGDDVPRDVHALIGGPDVFIVVKSIVVESCTTHRHNHHPL